ncbi:fatty acyl-CoA reductase wat-like [Leptopilina heterotoma]|uniref:fatty acyl-CoA reductase wat-like n=1 Tax=Leptopilina heterotoma TaxID=63436 RepID=UPI001CA9B67A|nr:fatty acyl-CoA reductase wat-like [Leptopilina heterotoma]
MQSQDLKSKTEIQNFYAGQSVLITGGTGFLGKLLIEKLLRCCPELTSIYVIIRRKENQDIHKRIQLLLEEPIYDKLKCENPEFLEKIISIEGNGRLPNYGISPKDRDILWEKISIVFHAAANVKFNEKLGNIIADNVFGTKQLIDICLCMKNLKAFMHISTFYSHCNRKEIDEKFYDSPITGKRILQMAEILSEEELECLEKILRKNYPNNYTFTKAITEQLIHQHGQKLPFGVFRPAIVSSTYQSPLQGWSDNFSGVNGIIAGGLTGVLKTMLSDKSKKMEVVPADLTINALIACAWDLALNKTEQEEDPFVYNYISTWTNSITYGEYYNLCYKHQVPSLNSVGYYSVEIFKYSTIYYISKAILQTLPASIVDIFLIIVGRKTWAMRINKKLSTLVNLVSYFALNDWKGKNERTKNLWNKISPDDQKLFPFSMNDFNWNDYIQKYMIGLRVYLLKDPLTTVPAATKRRTKFIILYRLLKYSLIILQISTFYKIYKKYLNFKNSKSLLYFINSR